MSVSIPIYKKVVNENFRQLSANYPGNNILTSLYLESLYMGSSKCLYAILI
jgi:hypothetical protein